MSTFYIDISKDYFDRYDLSKITEYINNKRCLSNSYFLHKLRKLPVRKYTKVLSQIMRAETISYEEYNFLEELWWLILYYNGIAKFQDLKQGTIVKLFSISDLEFLINDCILKQQLIENES